MQIRYWVNAATVDVYNIIIYKIIRFYLNEIVDF